MLKISILLFSMVISLVADEIQSFIDKANELKLYEHRHWLNLLHFNPKTIDMKNIFTLDGQSEIDSEQFFYAKDGKRDPKAELESSIKEFFLDVESVNVPKDYVQRVEAINAKSNQNLPLRSSKKEDYHAICRFPARFEFLDSVLHLSASANLPKLKCEEYNNLFKYVSPKSATMIFPSAHINSPASMFGHTFLLLNSSFDSRLLSFAINYAAASDPTKEDFLTFALKGLAGLYPGQYSMLPYYEKIKEYGDGENRDIWEFDLDLTQEEVNRLYKHIWELNDTSAQYYFFDENCSYAMLWLLEVARPSLKLRDRFVYQVMPTQSIFALEDEGIVTSTKYRPSKRNIILSYEPYLNAKEVKMAKSIAKGEMKPEAVKQNNIYVLEVALEYSQYLFLKSKLDKDKYVEISHAIATARSKYGKGEKPRVDTPYSPLDSNRNLRFQAYGGYIDGSTSSAIMGLDFRMTYHDIYESDTGFLRGAGIEFGKINAYVDKEKIRLNEAKIINITSLGFVSKFFTPPSYYMGMGFDRWDFKGNLSYYIHGGIGLSKMLGSSYVYALFTPEFRANAKYDSTKAKLNIGGSIGANTQISKDVKLALEYRIKAYDKDIFGNIFSLSFNYQIAKNFAFMIESKSQLLPKPYYNQSWHIAGFRAYF